MPKPRPKPKKKPKCHPLIKRAGLAKDPVFGKTVSIDHMARSTKEWLLNRYRRRCPGCGELEWTSPGTLPVCRGCWLTMPSEWRQWWWKSKRNQRSLEKMLDACFDGGYEVPFDERQASGCRNRELKWSEHWQDWSTQEGGGFDG